jgi:hypothetical protein
VGITGNRFARLVPVPVFNFSSGHSTTLPGTDFLTFSDLGQIFLFEYTGTVSIKQERVKLVFLFRCMNLPFHTKLLGNIIPFPLS